MAAKYPSDLSLPQREGYGMQATSPLQRTKMDSGRSRQRQKFSVVPVTVTASWLLTDLQACIFESWFRYEIENGAAWFDCPLRTPMGLEEYTARFIDIYDGPQLVGAGLWRYSAAIELSDRQTLPDGWASVGIEFLRDSKILDAALNEEWSRQAEQSE